MCAFIQVQYPLRAVCRKQASRTFFPRVDLLCDTRAAHHDLVIKLNHLAIMLSSPDSRA
jgi:hypothetical protein